MFKSLLFSGYFFLLHCPVFSQFTLYDLANTGEPVNKVTSIGVMNSGYVYAGTYDAGLVQYDGVNTWSTHDVSTSGFPNNYITSVYINSSDIWISTQFGGIGKYSGGGWTKLTNSNTSGKLPDDEVWGMHMDALGDLCIATFSGLAIDSIPNGNWKTYNMITTPALETESFYCILIDPAGALWLGTEGKGIAKFSNNTWQFYKTQNSGIANDTVNVIKRSSDGNYWIGTDLGLSKFNGTTWTIYTGASTGGGLPGDQVNSIALDNSGNVFVGTNNGIGVLNTSVNVWNAITTTTSNLPGNDIRALAIDPNSQELWIGTASQGLAVGASSILLSAQEERTMLSNMITFPNPTADILNIRFGCRKETIVQMTLLDLYGREIADLGEKTYGEGQYTVSSDFSGLAKGIYLLQIATQEGRITKSIQVY